MPKDGTVHELTSNVGAAQGLLGREGGPAWPRAGMLVAGRMAKYLVSPVGQEACHHPFHGTDSWPCTCPGMVQGGAFGRRSDLKVLPLTFFLDLFSPHTGHPLPTAAPGLPGDGRGHAGLPRYLASPSGAPFPSPTTPSCLETWGDWPLLGEIPSSPVEWGLTVPFLTRPPSLLAPSTVLALESGTPWFEDALPASPLLPHFSTCSCVRLSSRLVSHS